MKNHIEVFIENLRSTDRYIETIFLNGSCYKFAQFLSNFFGGEVVACNDMDHAFALIGGNIYDITGKVEGQLWFKPSEAQVQQMELWSFHKNKWLSVGECEWCEEPIRVKLEKK